MKFSFVLYMIYYDRARTHHRNSIMPQQMNPVEKGGDVIFDSVDAIAIGAEKGVSTFMHRLSAATGSLAGAPFKNIKK